MSRLWSVLAPRVCLTFRTDLPCVDTGGKKVNPLFKESVAKVMKRQEMEHYYVAPWLSCQEGEDREHKPKTPVGSLRTLTWSRGTNSRLPFGVNVNLNLFNIWYSIMNSLITSNNPTSTCSVTTLFQNGVFSCPCSFVAQRGNSGNEEVSFFTDILCSSRIWSLVQWVRLWPSVLSINGCAHPNDQFHQRKQDWPRISGGDHDVQMLGAIQAELILSWEDKLRLCSWSGRL